MILSTPINSACGLVRRADGKVLLVNNPRRGWEFPGGVIEQGESPLDALRREIFEESGVVAEPRAFVGAYANLSCIEGYGPLAGTVMPPRLNLAFLCDYVRGEPAPSDESTQVEWVMPEEARRRAVHPSVAKRLADMLDYAGAPVFRSYEMGADRSVRWIEETRLE